MTKSFSEVNMSSMARTDRIVQSPNWVHSKYFQFSNNFRWNLWSEQLIQMAKFLNIKVICLELCLTLFWRSFIHPPSNADLITFLKLEGLLDISKSIWTKPVLFSLVPKKLQGLRRGLRFPYRPPITNCIMTEVSSAKQCSRPYSSPFSWEGHKLHYLDCKI